MKPSQFLDEINAYIKEKLGPNYSKYGLIVVGSTTDPSIICSGCSYTGIQPDESDRYLPRCIGGENCVAIEVGIPITPQKLHYIKNELKIEKKIRKIAEKACKKHGIVLRHLGIIPIGEFKADLPKIEKTLFDGRNEFSTTLPERTEKLEALQTA